MEIVYKRVSDIKGYKANARRNDKGVPKVADSIAQFGFLNPIVVDANNVIIAGHTRLKAAKKLGLEEVPCIVHDVPEEEARLVRIIDNKSHEYATWDVDKLHKELASINTDFKNTFFTTGRDRKFFTDNKLFCFGNNAIPITDDDYKRLKKVYDDYLKRNKSYIGFIMYLTGAGER